jgi:hypothetical protein
MKYIAFFILLVFTMLILASCAVKRDCQGVKHYRQTNGIYL